MYGDSNENVQTRSQTRTMIKSPQGRNNACHHHDQQQRRDLDRVDLREQGVGLGLVHQVDRADPVGADQGEERLVRLVCVGRRNWVDTLRLIVSVFGVSRLGITCSSPAVLKKSSSRMTPGDCGLCGLGGAVSDDVR